VSRPHRWLAIHAVPEPALRGTNAAVSKRRREHAGVVGAALVVQVAHCRLDVSVCRRSRGHTPAARARHPNRSRTPTGCSTRSARQRRRLRRRLRAPRTRERTPRPPPPQTARTEGARTEDRGRSTTYALCLHTDHATPPVQRPRAEHPQQLQRLTCSHRSDPDAGTPDRAGPELTSTVLGTGSASTEPVRYCVRPLFCWPVTRRTWDPKGPIA
jgi:hypothetical protein